MEPSHPSSGTIRHRHARSLLDLAEKLSRHYFFLAIQRGLVLSLPLIMIGAMALLLRYFPYSPLPDFLDSIFGASWRIACDNLISGSFGIASLAVLCSFSGALTMFYNQRHKGQFVSPVLSVVVTLSCFFVVTAPAESTSWRTVFSMDSGLLVALCVAASACALFMRLSQCGSLRLSLGTAGHDPMARDVFAVMPAAMLTIAASGCIRAALVMSGFSDLHGGLNAFLAGIFAHAGNDLGGGLLYAGLCQIFWFFGAHGPNLLYTVEEHFLRPAGVVNAMAALSGQAPAYVFTKAFFDAFTRMGGSGSTLCLIIAILLASRDSGNRRLCLFALAPALCNVNEPLLFGIPLVLNPVYLIPFVLTPIIQTLSAYAATMLDLLPRTIADVVWTSPPLVGGYIATGSVAGVIMQLFNLALGTLLYYPFVKLAEQVRERKGKNLLNGLLRIATACSGGQGATKCIDLPGEEGRLAKALANDLREALERDEQLFLEYQPQMDVSNNRVYGVEALLRWRHPAFGPIPPPVTIVLAEDTGCIDRLGIRVMEMACRQRAGWKGQVPDDLLVAVNVSPRQLEDPAFDRHIMAILERNGLRPDQFEVEITESTVLTPSAAAVDTLHRLEKCGIHMAIDDFGMGHTSLRYLNEFRVDTIKLDRSLTERSREGVNDHIVQSIITLSSGLGITTIAEGIENEEQLNRFRALGCHIFQGYLFSSPLTGDDCLAFIIARASTVTGPPPGARRLVDHREPCERHI